MNIQELRQNIDQIDHQLVSLFAKRMEITRSIAEYKRENQLPVLDSARERALLARVAELSPDGMEDYTETLYATILSLSRSYQHQSLAKVSSLYGEISSAIEQTDKLFPARASVACQGVEGAYSQSAAERLFRSPSILFFSNFEAVFSAIESGLCQYGVLPIENSTAGSVKQVYDLMIEHNFKIVRSTRIKVDHCLLAKRGTKLSDIREIFSHEQAIGQCAEFLATLSPEVKITRVENTAAAAQRVAASERTDAASLSSASCAALYGLSTLATSVQDNDNNHTRFLCISKNLEIYPGADRTSLMVVTPHKPGALYRILSRFNALGINLLKLESRPIPNRDFEFMFYFDLETSVYSPKFAQLLSELEQECEVFSYLGSYTEVV